MTTPVPQSEAASAAHADAVEVTIPREQRVDTCPDCEREMVDPEGSYILAKPADKAHELNDVMRCPFCNCIWSPRQSMRTVIRLPATMDLEGTDLTALVEAVAVTLPYPGRDYVCPECSNPIPTRKQIRLAKPARHAHELNDVLRCYSCTFLFSPKAVEATVLRR